MNDHLSSFDPLSSFRSASNLKFFARSWQVCFCLVLIARLMGCDDRNTIPVANTASSQPDTRTMSERMYDFFPGYLNGDAATARRSMMDTIRLIQNMTLEEKKGYKPGGPASWLVASYCRLYLIDEKMSNDALAKADLLKAQYWDLIDAELEGYPEDQAIDWATRIDKEYCHVTIERLDKGTNNGRLPHFMLMATTREAASMPSK